MVVRGIFIHDISVPRSNRQGNQVDCKESAIRRTLEETRSDFGILGLAAIRDLADDECGIRGNLSMQVT